MDVDPSVPEYTQLQEQECQKLLQLLREMDIATAVRPYSGSKEATLRLLRPWDIFGHLAFEGEARQRAYVEAVTECEVTKVPKVFVERAIRREPQVAFRLMTLLELRLVQYEELVKCLLPRETEVRLANLLPILAQKFGERRDSVVTIDLRLTHQDLAAMVASTRESVTKVLNEMRNRDLIEIEAGRITLKDSRALAELGRP